MAIYDDTVKKYKQYLKEAQIEALMEQSRQYNRENAGNRADAVSQARSDYDTAYRGLQNMGLAGAKGTEITGEVPRLKTNIAGQFNRVNAQLYNREQQAVEALGGQYAAQTKAQQAAEAAARASAASQVEAEEAAKRNAVGGLVTGAVSAALAGQTKPNANTATLIPSKGQRIGMETAAKARGTGGMVTAATAAAIAQQEFEQKKALAAMQALGIRRSKFASSPTQKTAAQTTVNALQSSQAIQQEYLSAMEMLRRAQAGAQKDPRAGSGVAYYADKVGEILSNATIPTEQRVQMAMEYLQADVDERTSPLADRKAKEIIARAYGLKVPKSDETFDALDKARRSKTGGLGYGVGATYDKDAEIAFRQEQSNRAEYNYYMPAIANKIRYAGKTGKVNDKETDFVYNVINGKITEETLKKLYGRSDPGTKYRYLLLDEEEKNAYNYLYEKKGLKAANDYADSLMPLLEMRGAEEDQAAWEEYTKEHPVAANIHSIGLSAAEIAPAISRVVIGAYNEISGTKNPAYVDTNSTLYSGTNRRTTIRTKTSGMILGDNPTGWQKVKNFAYNTGMSMADSATMLPFAYAGLPWVSDLVFFSSASNEAYKDAISRGANQADAILAGAASGIAEALFEHVSLDKVVKMSTSGKGKFIMNILKQAGIEASEEACTSIANLITDKLFLGELSNNELDRKNYIQEYMATGMSREEAEKKANIQVFTDTIKDIGMDALGGFASGLGFGLFGAATNAYTQKQIGKEVKQNSEVLDNDYRVAELLGGETADLARKYDQRSITEMEAGDLHTAIVSKLQEQAEVSEKNAETVAAVLDGREISADQAADMLQSSKDFLQEAGYDTSSAEALAASYNQRVEEVATSQKEAFDNRARDYNIKRAEEVYTDKEALRNVPLTLPTGVSPVQFADAERNNFKSRTTIQADGVELQLSLMDMDGRFTNEQKLERARKAMTAQAQRKLDMIGKISKALGMDVVVHDYMRGSNGYFGEDGKIHFVLSGHMSVARVAAHELTHQMQSVASEKYTVVRDQLIEDVGQDRFDRLLKRKAAQYGYNMESEQGRLACDEEVIAELCEGMLSDKDRLERFAERHTDTALTLKDRLTKILNAIHATLKDTFGQNQNRISDMITDEKTADKWLDGLDEVLKRVQEKQQTEEFSDAGTKYSIREEAPPVKTGIAYKVFFVKDGKLYPPMVANPGGADTPIGVWLNADVGAAAPDSKTGRQQVKAGGKGTQGGSGSLAFRPGWHLGDIPRASQFDRLNQATGKKELFPENFVWAECEYAKDVDYQKEAMSYGYTENGKYRHSYAGLPRIPKDGYYRYRTNPNPETVPWVITGAMKVNRLLSDAEVNSILEKNGVAPVHRQGGDVSLEDLGFANVQERKSTLEGAIGETANVTSVDQDNLVEELKEAKTERQVDEKINKYCVDITRSDLAGYRQDLLDSGLVGEGKPISQKALNGLFNLMTKVCDKVSMHRAILDFGPELKTEAAKENRAYVPYKQNADPHYKLALDFSTLCRKRILLQTIAERLQAKMGRAVTQEETVAIRLELQKLQQEGMKIEVACALCYVEAARLKSPKAINAFLNNPEAYMRKYLAQKVGTAKEQVAEQQRKWKEEHGYHPNETKSNMSAADEKAYNDFSKLLRESLSMDEESERIIARAVDVVRNTPEKLLSAKGIEQLKKSLDTADRTLVDAFVTQVRNSTRSKAQETDTPYVRGDAKRLVPDSVIQYANQESGFRHQSWSDFQVIHMLDTMAAVIELAQRRAKMHAYTKVPAMVEMCGYTGMMINMSLIPYGITVLDANGNLIFDRVEGMPWDIMMDLRDRFPDTAGNIAIGINDAQIRALLASEDIDYVIPYHASGMNKNMRKYLDIRSWTEYTSTQNERGNNRGKKGDAPALAEWFNEAEAVKAKDGNAYMREASEKYLQLCYERNLIPKFSQYLMKGEDGRYSLSPEYENYWKMLVDRKMVNQKTGKVIQQKPVLPVFDDATIMKILDDRLADPAVQDAEKAADIVTSRFADWTKGRNNASAEAIEEAKRIRDRSAALTVQKTVGSNGTRYALDTDYYDYSRSFAQQIDDYVAGKFPERDTFVLGKTPDIFQKVGLSALPMTMDQIHVDYALNGTKNADHQLGAALLKQLPTLMEKPVAIIESATHPNNSVMAIVKGEVNGKQVTAAVRVGGTGRQNGVIIDSNHLVSVQGRQNAVSKLLVQAMEKENAGETGVYYINKTEAQDLCARAGLQLPGSAAQDGLIHSIFDAGSPVNRKYVEQTETRQFKRWFGNSKVVNADGTPMKVYHQTENDFTVFDPRKGGAGSRDEGTPFGIFLKSSPRDIGLKGKKQMELYVSIENPLRAANREDFSAQMRKMSPEYDTLIKEHEALDAEYKAKNREAKDALVNFMVQWRKDNPGADSRALYEVDKFNELFDAEDTLLDEWTAKADAISVKAKEALTSALEKNGYDGVILETDEGSWGRKTDAYIALRPEQVKSATDNIGTFDRNNPDIRYSLDTEQLEKTVRAIDTKALEEGLQSMTLTSNVNSFTMKDPSRFFDAISKNNTELRDELHDIFEKPHSEATGKYARGIKDMQERVRNIATEAGILSKDGKKFDKAASAAVQNYGEGYQLKKCTVEAKVVDADTVFINAVSDGINVLSGDFTLQEVRKNFGRENGDMIWEKAFDQAQKNSERGQKASAIEYESTTSPYKLTDLQTQFPRTWQKLVEADKAFREMYDEYIGNMNAMLREIYPNSFTKEDDTVAKIDDLVEKKKHRITDTEKAIAERMKSLGKVEAEMAAKKRTDTKAYDTLRRRQTALNEAIADLNEKKAGYNEDIAALAVKKNAIFELDKSGESLNRMHQLEYRQDYYHHFNEMSVGLKEAWNLILQGSNRDISPAVVGNTSNSKAKTRWAGFFQQRKGGAYTADAVNGMLKYGALAEYKLAFDPLVAYLRDAEKKIRDVSDETNRNSLILYLNSWTNQIAGKSSDFDRLLTDRGVVGRNILNFLQKLNGRVIRNTLYFNARSAIVQISNISNAVSLVTNPKDWKNGVLCWSRAAKGDEMMQNIMSQSNFLASRFAGVEMMDTSTMAKAERFANWMLSIADTISAKATWWAAYNQYVRDPNSKSIVSMPRKYDSAVDYADDVTRRTHGGRGVGEKAPIMTSKLVSFFAPFQLEVNNTYQLLKENIKKKNALGIATMEATVFAMNAVFEAIVGSTVLPFDFIRALIDILFGAKDILDDDDDDHKLASTFKLIGQRIGAETVSGLPYAGMIPQFLGEDTTEAVFGETDMTKYGNVNMGVGGAVGIGKVLASLAKWGAEGVKPDWFSMVNELSEVLPPIGGKQIARTIGGLTTVAQGYSGKTNSKGEDTVQFATDTNVLNYIHAGIFGKWALTEASEYFGEDRILPKLFGYYNGESASAGSPVKAEEFHAARALGLSGKGYFTIRKELKEYRTQEGKRSSLYTTNLTPAQKAGMDALLISTKGTSSEAKSEGAIVYGRTKQEDGSWGEWKVKADYSSEDLFKLSLYGDTKYSAGTTAMKNGAGIKNVLGLLDTVDAYNDANKNPMTATQKRDWLRENVKDTKQAALLDAYILSKNKSTNVKVEGNVVYTMSLGEDGKPSVTKDGTVAEWKVKADYTDDTWYAISRHGDSKYRKGLTAVRKGVNPKTIRKYLDDMQAYQDSKNQSMSFEERGQWIRKNGGTPKEQAILDAYMLRKDSNTDAKVKDGIVYTLELGEDGKPKVYKSGSVAEWKVKADYTSDEWYAVSQTDHYDKAKTAYSACGIKPTVFVDFYTRWSDLSAKDASGKTVSGLKKKRTKELLDKMKISTEQKAYLYYKVCGYK